MRVSLLYRSAIVLAASAAAWVAVTQLDAQQKSTRQVNDAILKSGGKQGEEWVSYSVNWAEQRYSPLAQITAANVASLKTVWSLDVPAPKGSQNGLHPEATPLYFNGVLYSIAPWSVVYAV